MQMNYKKVLMVIIAIISVILIYKLPRLLISKNNEQLPEVKLKEKIEQEKTLAIMISEDGSNYQKYERNEWPNENYKFKDAKCIDNNGNLVENTVSFDNVNKTIILETDKTVSCTIYFDKSTLGKLRYNEKIANKDNLSSDIQGGMYRYQGTDNVANWICFGTTDNCGTNDDLIDKYMYRIIGVTPNDELYLLKEVFIKEGDETLFTWNDKYTISGEYAYTCDDKVCPEWSTSLLFKRLNGTSNGETQGVGTTSDKANTDIFVDSEYYNYLISEDSYNGEEASKWYNLIADHNWIYGDTTQKIYNGKELYDLEISKKNQVKSKISLMYMHDVVYAYYDGLTEKSRGNPGSNTNVVNSWIHFQKDGYISSTVCEWLSTRYGIYSNYDVGARVMDENGNMSDSALSRHCGVRPVFYLSSKAKIASGNGTKANPYMLD